MKVLLMAYECSPYRGSEWAVGWGRLLQAARCAETHVVTSEANFAALTRARDEGLVPANVQFYTPAVDARLRKLEAKPVLFAYNYTAYNYWQTLAYGLARELHAEHGFDVVHQVNVVTFREPGYAWKLPVPFVWGPVGGSQNFPWRFLSMLPIQEAAKEAVRSVTNFFSLRMKPHVRAAAKQAACLYAANSTNLRDYERVFRRPVELLLETGLQRVDEPDRARFEERVRAAAAGEVLRPLQILWSGELQTRKALPVLLRALASLGPGFAYELTVLGDGPMRARWEAEAETLGVAEHVTFAGRLPFAEAVAQMQKADVFVFTSLRDTSGNVLLEALAAGVPVVTFAHQGAGDMADASCGVLVPVRGPREAVRDFAAALRALAHDAERMLRMSHGATARARMFLWDANGDRVNAKYRELAGESFVASGSVGSLRQ